MIMIIAIPSETGEIFMARCRMKYDGESAHDILKIIFENSDQTFILSLSQ
jgi:hypothetical protein